MREKKDNVKEKKKTRQWRGRKRTRLREQKGGK